MKSVKEFGEPGFVWTDHLDMTSSVREIGLYPQIDGVSGFAFCNLCEINMGIVDDKEKFGSPARPPRSSARCRPTTPTSAISARPARASPSVKRCWASR
jgi:hypothetical protein